MQLRNNVGTGQTTKNQRCSVPMRKGITPTAKKICSTTTIPTLTDLYTREMGRKIFLKKTKKNKKKMNLPGDSDLRIMFGKYCLMRLLKEQLLILAGFTPFGYSKAVAPTMHTHN